MNVCLIGTGYVGLVTGAGLAYLGHDVTCVDVDAEKIAQLCAGRVPFYEPGIEALVATGQRHARLSFTTELNQALVGAEVIFMAVGTPPGADGSPDLSYVKAAAQGIARGLVATRAAAPRFRVIVNKSTVPVGCGNWVEMIVREEVRALLQVEVCAPAHVAGNGHRPHAQARTVALSAAAMTGNGHASGNGHAPGHGYNAAASARLRALVDEIGASFAVVSNPEFLREGSAISDSFYPDRVVIGANDERALARLTALYSPILEQSFAPPAGIAPRPAGLDRVPLVATDMASAEMIKYAANAFLAMKISFANEMAYICEQTGADVARVMHGVGLDMRIGGRFLNAGIGWGGSCFGKDVAALVQMAAEYGYRPELLEATRAVNQRQRRYVRQKLQGALKLVKGRTVGLLGLAFKPETDDVRDAPSADIAADLLRLGARVKVYDPVAMKSFHAQHPALEVVYTRSVAELAADCDALVVVTEWQEFRALDLAALRRLMRGGVLVDGRNIFDPQTAKGAGFQYLGVGR